MGIGAAFVGAVFPVGCDVMPDFLDGSILFFCQRRDRGQWHRDERVALVVVSAAESGKRVAGQLFDFANQARRDVAFAFQVALADVADAFGSARQVFAGVMAEAATPDELRCATRSSCTTSTGARPCSSQLTGS